jgi:hypothetical protein
MLKEKKSGIGLRSGKIPVSCMPLKPILGKGSINDDVTLSENYRLPGDQEADVDVTGGSLKYNGYQKKWWARIVNPGTAYIRSQLITTISTRTV